MADNHLQCVGFIMDGNRRWAKIHNLTALEGHRQGAETFEVTVRFLLDKKIPHGIFYAFSSENWQRSEEEVLGLIQLFHDNFTRLAKLMAEEEKKIAIRFVGNLEEFDQTIRSEIKQIENENSEDPITTIWIALSYGGRSEIITAVNQAVQTGHSVSEETFADLLMTANMPDPDLIIRTGGQQRLSNFLPWQSVYSELCFLDCLWPELTTDKLETVLADYTTQQRNFGK